MLFYSSNLGSCWALVATNLSMSPIERMKRDNIRVTTLIFVKDKPQKIEAFFRPTIEEFKRGYKGIKKYIIFSLLSFLLSLLLSLLLFFLFLFFFRLLCFFLSFVFKFKLK